jgi:hypothetical protein
VSLAVGLTLAIATAVAFNWAWVTQHSAAAQLPPLTVRAPLLSLRRLFAHRRWVAGFSTGLAAWVFYVVALRLAPLSLVQAASAGGFGVLGFFAQRASGETLPRREWIAVAVAALGLALLGVSLLGTSEAGRQGAPVAVGGWLAASAGAAALFTSPAGRALAPGAGFGIAAGIMYGAGDVGTKAAVHGGLWLVVVPAVLACHGLAFAILQLGFQRGTALATAGLSSLFTNALPIAAGVAVFHEHLPPGARGAARIVAFACVVAAAAVLARRESGEP